GYPGREKTGMITSRPLFRPPGRFTSMARSAPTSKPGAHSAFCRCIASIGARRRSRPALPVTPCTSSVPTPMSRWRTRLALLSLLSAISLNTTFALSATCTHKGVELQVLGSGGPELEDQRASSSYLIWQDGKPRVVVDSGGGSALQFGRA